MSNIIINPYNFVLPTPTLPFIDDFTGADNFSVTGGGYSFNAASDRLDFNIPINTLTKGVYDLGSVYGNIGADDWYMFWDEIVTSLTGSAATVSMGGAISPADDYAASNYYTIDVSGDSTHWSFCYANGEYASNGGTWIVGTMYYYAIRVTASTGATTFKRYASAADRTSDTSPQFTVSKTPASNETGLKWVYFGNSRPTNKWVAVGYIDYVEVGLQ